MVTHTISSKRAGILSLLIFLVMIISVSAYYDYTYVGSTNDNYERGLSRFNDELTTAYITGMESLGGNDLYFSPLVGDMRGDGSNIIAVLNDGDNICVYEYQNLTQLDCTGALPHTTGEYRFMTMYDIDSDSEIEIITAEEYTWHGGNISIIGFNGTDLVIENSFPYDVNITGYDPQVAIKCCGTSDDCLAIITSGSESNISSLGENHMYITGVMFNYTGVRKKTIFDDQEFDFSAKPLGYGRGLNTFPLVRNIDCMNDVLSNTWYVMTAYQIRANSSTDSNTDQIILMQLDTPSNSSTAFTRYTSQITDDVYESATRGVLINYDDEWSKYLSSPISGDFDANPLDGNEIAYTNFGASDVVKNHIYYDGVDGWYAETPTSMAGDMEVVYLGNSFVSSYNNLLTDEVKVYCSQGTDVSATIFMVLCSLPDAGGLYTDYIFRAVNSWAYGTPGIIDESAYPYQAQVMLIESDSEPTCHDVNTGGRINAPELLTAYGVLQFGGGDGIWGGDCDTDGECDAEFIYKLPLNKTSIISVDPVYRGYEELIMLDASNNTIYYLSDGYTGASPSNHQAELINITICPSINEVWQLDGNISVYVTIADQENDASSVQGTLYYGLSYAQTEGDVSNLSNYPPVIVGYPNGYMWQLQFVADHTTLGKTGILRLEYADTEHYTSPAVRNYAFQVSTIGAVADSSCTSIFYITTTNDSTTGYGDGYFSDVTGQLYANNTITTGLASLTDALGLGLGLKALWMILIILGLGTLVVSAYTYFSHVHFVLMAVICVIWVVLMMILGLFLGIFGWGMLIVIILVALAVIILQYVRPMLTGGG